MSSKTTVIAVALVVVIAVGFVLAGSQLDVSPFGVAAIIAAVAFGAGMLGLMALLLTLIGTVRELTSAVEQVTDQTVPLLSSVNETVAGVNTELARVDAIVASVQHISGQAEGIADVVHTAVTNPLIKGIAFVSGAGTAMRSARRRKSDD